MTNRHINIGLLHSLSGPMAASEKNLITAMELAVEEINQTGGILGRRINPVIRDGKSDYSVFAEEAQKLIDEVKVVSVFGCWTSSSRKAVKEIVESRGSILWYPVQYEGLEQSPNIIYTGCCLNQQIIPAVEWALSRNKKNFCLIGSDYIFPRTVNSLIKALLNQHGGRVTDEIYFPLESTDYTKAVECISAVNTDMVFNTINGEGNISFFKEIAAGGIRAEDTPILSFSLSETEEKFIKEEGRGHYASLHYFQTIDTEENRKFIQKISERNIPIAASVMNAYSQIYLWKEAVERCKSFDPQLLLQQIEGTGFQGPIGNIKILSNNHVCHRAYIGQATGEGLFNIVHRTPVIDPEPWIGIDKSDVPYKELVLEALQKYSEVVHVNCSLCDEIEKRKELEERLSARNLSLIRLKQAVEQSPLSIVIAEPDGTISYVNPKFESLTGYKAAEIIGNKTSILRSDLSPPETYTELWETISCGKAWNGELLNSKKNGDLYWERASIAPIYDREGNIINYMAVKEDISQQKMIEAELQNTYRKIEEEKTKFLKFFSNNPAIMAVSRLSDNTIIDVNDSFLYKLGFSREEVIGKTFDELCIFDDPEKEKQIEEVFKEQGKVENAEIKIKSKSNGILDGLFSADTIVSQDKEYLLSVMIDITVQKFLQSFVDMESKRLNYLILGSRLGTWEWNIKTGETIFNKQWAELIGYTLNELQPISITTWLNLAHPEDLKISEKELQRHFRGEIDFYDAECRMKHKKGHWVWIRDRGKVIEWDENGEPLRMYGTHSDITYQKELEAKIIEISNHDPLTNIYNRRYLFQRLEKDIEKYKRDGVVFSIAILDIDLFKNINDTHGHLAGDFILQQFSLLLTKNLRTYDLLGRYGGEEFIIVSYNVNRAETAKNLMRILTIIRTKVFTYKKADISFTFSGGVSDISEPERDEMDIEHLISIADKRLYKVKENGRNRISCD